MYRTRVPGPIQTKPSRSHPTLADGGGTDPDNGNPKCRKHHLLGNHGYTTRRDKRGRWSTFRPDGTEIC